MWCFLLIVLQEEVSKVNSSGNLDSPEGGMDALMQATVCTVSRNVLYSAPKEHLSLKNMKSYRAGWFFEVLIFVEKWSIFHLITALSSLQQH